MLMSLLAVDVGALLHAGVVGVRNRLISQPLPPSEVKILALQAEA